MVKKRKAHYIVGMAAIILAVTFVLIVITLLCKPVVKIQTLYDTVPVQYEKLVGNEMSDTALDTSQEYSMVIKGGHADAVKMTMTLEDSDIYYPSLDVFVYDPDMIGSELFIDGKLIYANIQGDKRNSGGFLLFDENTIPKQNVYENGGDDIRVSLPEDYVGKTMSIISYYSKDATAAYLPLLYICGEQTDMAVATTNTVVPVAVMTLCAIFLVIILLIFTFDKSSERPNYKILLLALFFLLLFIDKVYISYPGSYSILTKYLDLSFLTDIYIAPLLLYIALELSSWRKYALASTTVIWVVFECIFKFIFNNSSAPIDLSMLGAIEMIVFAVTFILTIIELVITRKNRNIKKYYFVITFIVLALRIMIELDFWKANMSLFYSALLSFESSIFVPIISEVVAVMAVIVVVINFIKRILLTQEKVTTLRERNRIAVLSYRRMEESENITAAAQHEIRHHILALDGMLRNNEIERAQQYISSLEGQFSKLPSGRYSKNNMINILVGSYLDRAKAMGVNVQHKFNIPQSIPIPDRDLCVFLTNMLENAVNACAKLGSGENKFMEIIISLEGNFLFIGCKNSYCEDEKKEDDRRSYGLENMRSVAEKYNGVLKIDKENNIFSVMTTFSLSGEYDDKNENQ